MCGGNEQSQAGGENRAGLGAGGACRCPGPRAHRTGQQTLFPSLWDPGRLSKTTRPLLLGVPWTGPQYRTGLPGRGEEDSRGSLPLSPRPLSLPEPPPGPDHTAPPYSAPRTATPPLVGVLPGGGAWGRLHLDLTWPGLPLEGDFLPPTLVPGVWSQSTPGTTTTQLP